MIKAKRAIIIAANILWLGITFYLLVKPDDGQPKRFDFPGSDKVAHVIIFAIMSSLINILIKHFSQLNLKVIYTISILAVTAFGAVMEIVQLQFFSRGCEFYDVVADFGGAALGCMLFPITYHTLRKLNSNFDNRGK